MAYMQEYFYDEYDVKVRSCVSCLRNYSQHTILDLSRTNHHSSLESVFATILVYVDDTLVTKLSLAHSRSD